MIDVLKEAVSTLNIVFSVMVFYVTMVTAYEQVHIVLSYQLNFPSKHHSFEQSLE